MSAVLSNLEQKKLFDAVADNYDQITNRYAVSRRVEALVSWARGECLEVGAGTGAVSAALVSKLPVVATDISPNMVEKIRERLNIPAFVCDGEHLIFDSESFDTVIACECIYYMNNPGKFIAEAHRVLRPNGRLLICSASTASRNFENARTFLRALGFKYMYFADRNRKFTTAESLKKLIESYGFKIQEVKHIVLFPSCVLDSLNRFLEKITAGRFGLFVVACAEKSDFIAGRNLL